MAGLGLDAQMLSGTSEPLKKRLGWFAYAISVAGHLGDRPMRVTISADGGRRRRMRANALIIGNVGWLRGGLPLLPDARPDDGVLTAGGLTGWLAVTAELEPHDHQCGDHPVREHQLMTGACAFGAQPVPAAPVPQPRFLLRQPRLGELFDQLAQLATRQAGADTMRQGRAGPS